MMPRTDIPGHFRKLAARYDADAFEAGSGVRLISQHEVALVMHRLGTIEGRRVLDAGVGTGRFARMLIQRGASVVGFDLSPEMLMTCARNEPRARLVQARLGSPLPFADGAFDHVICIRVIKYLDDWGAALRELRRLVRPGGRLVLEVANRWSLARWGYLGMPVHLITQREVARLLGSSGFRLRAIDPGVRLPFPIYRWARTPSRLRAIRFMESLLSGAFGLRVLARSLIFTCEADSEWDRFESYPPGVRVSPEHEIEEG